MSDLKVILLGALILMNFIVFGIISPSLVSSNNTIDVIQGFVYVVVVLFIDYKAITKLKRNK